MNKIFTRLKFPAAAALSAALLLLPGRSEAQLAANTYQFSAISGTFTEVTGGTALTSIQTDDALSASIPIGFTFNFCGTDYTTLRASSNGWVSFSSTLGTFDYIAGNATSNFTTLKPCLFPLWEDIDGSSTYGGAASYITTGTAPNRIFTLECKNWQWNYSATTATISFQVKLYEGSNLIQFVYRPESGTINTASGGASIGISDNSTPTGYLSLNNTTASPTASGTVFTDNILTKPAAGQIYQFKPLPAIDMKADSIVVAMPFCSNSTQPVSVKIRNLGTAGIDSVKVFWSVDGTAQTPVTYSGPTIGNIVSGSNTAIVPLGSVFFASSAARQIKAWTYLPNGLPDEVTTNDTVTAPVASGLEGVEVHILPGDTTICQGTDIVLDAGAFTKDPIYIWNNGSLSRTISVNDAGVYSVKVQNTDGCFDLDTVMVSVYPNPLVNSIAVMDNGGGMFTFNIIGAQNINEYFWDFGDGETASGPGPQVHIYTTPGEYTVTLTLKNDCGEVTVTRLVAIGGGTNIRDLAALKQEIKVFPNPAKSQVTIAHSNKLKTKSIAIYNLMGQKVQQPETVNAERNQINISGLAAGIYNVTIETDRGTVTKKLEVLP